MTTSVSVTVTHLLVGFVSVFGGSVFPVYLHHELLDPVVSGVCAEHTTPPQGEAEEEIIQKQQVEGITRIPKV